MGRPKGSKNKIAPIDPMNEKGNPDFNLSEIEPSDTIRAPGAVTHEDMELDRQLERMSREQEPPLPIDPEPYGAVARPEKHTFQLISEFVEDYKPASTINELMFQVDQAKGLGCDSIEATPALIKHYCRKHYPSDVGYFMFHDIRVYIPGAFEESVKRDKRTVHEFEPKGPIWGMGSKPTA